MKVTAEEVWVAADSKAHITRDKETSFAEVQRIFELDNSCVFAGSGLADSGDGTVMASDYALKSFNFTKCEIKDFEPKVVP